MLGRRGFIARTLTLFALASGLERRVWAQGAFLLRYRPLPVPVLVPLNDMLIRWRSRIFVADAVMLPSAATPNQPLRLNGMLVRTAPAGENTAEQFHAVCLRCPHEGCGVDLVEDPSTAAEEIVQLAGRPISEPVFVCPCHNSTFAVETGERRAGPAPRGLYRFRVTKVSDTAIEIGEVEEDLLLFDFQPVLPRR